MTQIARSSREWKGNTGVIHHDWLARHVSKPQGPVYYIAGSPVMVSAMHEMLVGSGIDQDNIRTEEFVGY